MKAIAYKKPYTNNQQPEFHCIERDTPHATGHDLLVEVHAISVNPIDIKVRQRTSADNEQWQILGRDAVGQVKAVGDKVFNFEVGDWVYYAGTINRDGSYAQYQLVDQRIAATKPQSLTLAEAAAIPLTAITAWEMLFDRLRINPLSSTKATILLIGAAGGVGSLAVQLLKARTQLTVIATASRPESQQWLYDLGSDYVLDHSQDLVQQYQTLGLPLPQYIFSINGIDQHFDEIVQLIAPQGHIGLIDDPQHFDILKFKAKSVAIHWESMFSRSVYQTEDMDLQGEILHQMAQLLDKGQIQSTIQQHLGAINVTHICQAHQLIETGKSIGKIVLEGFTEDET
ncbi:zinc-binding alcohol dehydrogenase family protein [Acinetobacter larvae]|uniref:Zinc-type alcohol dehydrogenase-like protein n=1 Tax=Acinetobacter larvae TaxID=1789224 RepID=A0A1B2LY65_9GAMM|nr:zinc-binding alcohol dehydrogenase family protein [Acinetobacter larvae]AOA57713.1 Zn-dependent oxidoreductase [Acinetobacter larvae]